MKVQTILLLGTSLLAGASVSAGPTHPLLKSKELYVVEIAALGPEVLHTFKDEKAWPRVEHRRTIYRYDRRLDVLIAYVRRRH